MVSRRADFTFQYNHKRGRHGWLRLTPAYSIKLVDEILNDNPSVSQVLDPFSGTGTTGLVCSTRGINCDLLEVNPFLVWLAQVKTARYSQQQAGITLGAAKTAVESATQVSVENVWLPTIHDIHRWWSPDRLHILAKLYKGINLTVPDSSPTRNLLLIAFCRLTIQWSNAAFNHQSMSFKSNNQLPLTIDEEEEIYGDFRQTVAEVVEAARLPLTGIVNVYLNDSRSIPASESYSYDCVITSPPYPNRMSYIRELRPYMYWLGHLREAREAGELDWKAIGGTWGIATSRLQTWTPDSNMPDIPQLDTVVKAIKTESGVLANYVHKYFEDVSLHFQSLYPVLGSGAKLFYIVGNSKFYNTLVPVEQLYADIMLQSGFRNIVIKPLRKRNSKKELYEYLVSCER